MAWVGFNNLSNPGLTMIARRLSHLVAPSGPGSELAQSLQSLKANYSLPCQYRPMRFRQIKLAAGSPEHSLCAWSLQTKRFCEPHRSGLDRCRRPAPRYPTRHLLKLPWPVKLQGRVHHTPESSGVNPEHKTDLENHRSQSWVPCSEQDRLRSLQNRSGRQSRCKTELQIQGPL